MGERARTSGEPWGRLLSLCRRAFRKLVYRRTVMARYEVTAGESRAPAEACPLQIRLLAADELGLVAESNPYLTPEDLQALCRQTSLCLVVLDGDRVAASSWITSGQVPIHELERVVDVPAGEHYVCRSYVDPLYRGRALHHHMLHERARLFPPDHLLWCLVYEWNVSSIRSLEAAGWRRTGRCWTRFLFTRQATGRVPQAVGGGSRTGESPGVV